MRPDWYVMTAAFSPVVPDERDTLDFGTACKPGRPRPNDRISRVRRIYSLRHEANALRRVNERRCDFSLSSAGPGPVLIDSAPGKYRAKAILHAGGVVTNLWKRRETRLMDDKVSGGRWERICVSTSVEVSGDASDAVTVHTIGEFLNSDAISLVLAWNDLKDHAIGTLAMLGMLSLILVDTTAGRT